MKEHIERRKNKTCGRARGQNSFAFNCFKQYYQKKNAL